MTTIAEWNRVDMPDEVRGLWKTIHTESELGPFLQFKETSGPTFDYEREKTNPVAGFISDQGTISESSLEFTEKTGTLKTVAVQSALNLKKQQTANKSNPLAILTSKMQKSWMRALENAIINADTTVNSDEFDGLNAWCRDETRMMAMDDGVVDGPGAAETELTLDRLDEMIDTIAEGKPHALIMNRTMKRKLKRLMYAAGGGVQLDRIEMFGRSVEGYNDIPVVVNDYISNADTYADAATWPSSTATTIYAIKFGEESEGFTLMHNGGFLNVEMIPLSIPRDEHVRPYRMIGFPGSVVWSPLTIAALGGIDSTA